MILFSVIIPVYNAESTIEACVLSLVKQDTSTNNFEIILVNDGSSDDSLDLCSKLANDYEQVKCFSQLNQGVSTARNIGLAAAVGQYIWFVDADDLVDAHSFNRLNEVIIQYNYPEIIGFNYRIKECCGTRDVLNHLSESIIHPAIDLVISQTRLYVWDKVYRKDVIGKVRFVDGTINIEDMCFNLNVLTHSKELITIPDVLYQYNCLTTSSTSRSRDPKKLAKLDSDTLIILSKLKTDIEHSKDDHVRNVLKEALKISLAGHLYSLYRFYSPGYAKKDIKFYKSQNLYPVEKTQNKKANTFLRLANHEWIFYMSIRINRLITQIKKMMRF